MGFVSRFEPEGGFVYRAAAYFTEFTINLRGIELMSDKVYVAASGNLMLPKLFKA
jgi:hypothetical protein